MGEVMGEVMGRGCTADVRSGRRRRILREGDAVEERMP